MKLDHLLKLAVNLPVIETEILYTGASNPASIEVQISRWKAAGKIRQLRKGLYMLSEPYNKTDIYEPYLAGVLKKPSYISLEKALEMHNLIPEGVSVYTSVTTKRAWKFTSPLGTFDYRHIQKSLFWGYQSLSVNQQTAFLATPEKALLDFFYLNPVEPTTEYLEELRLQNTEKINLDQLHQFAKVFHKPKMTKAASVTAKYCETQKRELKIL